MELIAAAGLLNSTGEEGVAATGRERTLQGQRRSQGSDLQRNAMRLFFLGVRMERHNKGIPKHNSKV